jgi:carbonic anhydrase
VRWIVLEQPVQVSKATLDAFHALIADLPGYDGFTGNNRPVRPRNGRVVLETR